MMIAFATGDAVVVAESLGRPTRENYVVEEEIRSRSPLAHT